MMHDISIFADIFIFQLILADTIYFLLFGNNTSLSCVEIFFSFWLVFNKNFC